MRHLFAAALFFVSAGLSGACASPEGVGASSDPIVESIRSIVQRTDGCFDVTCTDGRTEVVTADQVRANQVCGAAPAAVTVRYACDSSANLAISVVDADGNESTGRVGTGSFATCNATVQSLQQTRGAITRPSIVGVCDASVNLERFSATTAGALKRLATTNIGSFSTCNAQATALNR